MLGLKFIDISEKAYANLIYRGERMQIKYLETYTFRRVLYVRSVLLRYGIYMRHLISNEPVIYMEFLDNCEHQWPCSELYKITLYTMRCISPLLNERDKNRCLSLFYKNMRICPL